MIDPFLQKVVGTGILGLVAAAMIYARRHNCKPGSDKGYGIAGWTMFILICMWLD